MIGKYGLLPFNFEKCSNNKVLLVNECGQHIQIDGNVFEAFITKKLDNCLDVYKRLKSNHFLYDSNLSTIIKYLSSKYRTHKEYLKTFTALHMVVTTLRCNQRCRYCHASSQEANPRRWDMSKETARKVVELIFHSPSPEIKIEFQGGEPILNFEVVKLIVNYAKQINLSKGKHLEFVLCTNLTSLTDEQIDFIGKNNITISTSLDGPQHLHDKHRILRNLGSSYDLFRSNLKKIRERYPGVGIGALMTTSRDSLEFPKEIVDSYVENGFNAIFLRSLNPYGYAQSDDNKSELEYDTIKFMSFYKKALKYILDLNHNGTYFVEHFSSILLTKIFTPFCTGFVDLQNPVGAGISGVIYNFDGSVYPTDESRMLSVMGDDYFNLGNVHEKKYEQIFLSKKLKEIIEASVLETDPGCHFCPYLQYCGIDPIRSYNATGNLHDNRPSSEHCKKMKGIFRYLFELIYSDNSGIDRIFWSWINSDPKIVHGEK